MGDVADSLEILEDGSVLLAQRVVIETIDVSKVKIDAPNADWNNMCIASLPLREYAKIDRGKIAHLVSSCNSIAYNDRSTMLVKDSYISYNGNFICIALKQNETIDTTEAINILGKTITICYQLATPITTSIPKELVPTILTHNQTNILEAGGAVKPSSFYFDIPVEKLIYDNKSQIVENKLNKAVLEVEKQLALLEYQQLIGGDFNV